MGYISWLAYEKVFAVLLRYKNIFKYIYVLLCTLSMSTLPDSYIATSLLWVRTFELQTCILRNSFIETLLYSRKSGVTSYI